MSRVVLRDDRVGAERLLRLMIQEVAAGRVNIVRDKHARGRRRLFDSGVQKLDQLQRFGSRGRAEVEHVVVRLHVHEERGNHRDLLLAGY